VQLVVGAIQDGAHASLLENHVLVKDRMMVFGDLGVRGKPKYLDYRT